MPVDHWFESEILPLEGALMRFLRRRWRDPAEIDDLRQEIYVRVYESALTKIPSAAAPHLFAVARNLLIDKARREKLVTFHLVADLAKLNVLSDEVGADCVLSDRDELRRLQAIVSILPPRCREVFYLRKVLGHPQKEVAAMLGIAQGTVEKQLAKAMRVLTKQFHAHEGTKEPSSAGESGTYETLSRSRG